jgi:uncharacterized phage infection (PIP) family protein YhgE
MDTPNPAPAGSSPKPGFTDRLKQDGKRSIESGKESAAQQIEGVADALNRAGSELDSSQPTLASYAGQLADGVSDFADRLRHKSVDELLTDTQELARRNPALFLMGSIALGVVVVRFLKASSRSAADDDAYSSEYGAHNAYEEEDTYSEEFGSSRSAGVSSDPTLDLSSTVYKTNSGDRDGSGSTYRSNGG